MSDCKFFKKIKSTITFKCIFTFFFMHQVYAHPGYFLLGRGIRKAENDQNIKLIQKIQFLLSVFGCKYFGGFVTMKSFMLVFRRCSFFFPTKKHIKYAFSKYY